MGFADAYLLKAGLRESLITQDPFSDLKLIVTIPVHRESGLARCLDSLFMAMPLASAEVASSHLLAARGESELAFGKPDVANSGLGNSFRCEVLILINASASAPAEVLQQNLATLSEVQQWIASHPHPLMDFHVWLDHSFGRKEAGVGMARKILMDEAVRRFSAVGNPGGIIASMDADTLVDPNYFSALAFHFEDPSCEGCSIRFEHPLEGEAFPPAIYTLIAQYELHLHYYLSAVRSTGYPFAFHTVGSAFAVRAGIYCMEGGMNKRQAGEDFYFIQKVAQRGHWSECNTTCVFPSPRPSDRVPFGTGPVVERLSQEAASSGAIPSLYTYHPEPFAILRSFFFRIDVLFDLSSASAMLVSLQSTAPVLSAFLTQQKFTAGLEEIRSNSGSPEAFRKRFWRWFNMFRIMKFVHYARERGYPDMDVGDAVYRFLSLKEKHSSRELLELFRKK